MIITTAFSYEIPHKGQVSCDGLYSYKSPDISVTEVLAPFYPPRIWSPETWSRLPKVPPTIEWQSWDQNPYLTWFPRPCLFHATSTAFLPPFPTHFNPLKQRLSPHFTGEKADFWREGKWLVHRHSWLVAEPEFAPGLISTPVYLLPDTWEKYVFGITRSQLSHLEIDTSPV